MKSAKSKAATLSLVCCLPVLATAQNLITNGSFELGIFQPAGDSFEDNPVGSTKITGWAVVIDGLNRGQNGNPYHITASNGIKLLDLAGRDNIPPHGAVRQTISTVIGQQYIFSMDLGTYQDDPGTRGPITASVSVGSASRTFTHNPTGTGNQWATYSFDFTADSSQTTITIQGISGVYYIGLDNVSVIPPPALNVIRHPNLLLDPRSTYLRYNATIDVDPLPPHDPPQNPAILNLIAIGIAPGDYLFLERSGRFRWSSEFSTEDGRNVWAVFSSSDIVYANPGNPAPKRIPGAILPENVSSIVTGPTLLNNQGVEFPTDIPEDFMADRVLVKVPVGATHLMFGAGDIKWADNLDGPPADFQIAVTQIRDPLFDTDGDGTSDLDEIRSGTDYTNPLSHPSLTIATAPLPATVRTTWTAQPFRIYQIEESTDLSTWSTTESPLNYSVPTLIQRDYPLSPPKRFYRARVTGMYWD